VKIIPERHRQTDGRTDRQTAYCSITALCTSASRGKNYQCKCCYSNRILWPKTLQIWKLLSKFLRLFDHLFDVLNSRNPLARGYKVPMKPTNAELWQPFLQEAYRYIVQLKDAADSWSLEDGFHWLSVCNSEHRSNTRQMLWVTAPWNICLLIS